MNNPTTDDLAAIIAAATERAGWQLSKAQGVAPAVLDENLHLVACEIGRDNAEWTANAPRIIIALVERIRELGAQRDALQAGEWKRVEDIPDKPDDVHYTDCELLLRFNGWYNHKYGDWSIRTPADSSRPIFWKPLPKP